MSAIRDITMLRTFTAISVRDASNTLRTAQKANVRDTGNASRLVFSAFGGGSGVTVSPSNVRGFGNSPSSITVSTATASVTVTSGTAPYTYAWTQLTGTGSWSAISPTSSSSAFRRTFVGQGDSETSTWKCTVTDANGNSSDSPTVTAFVNNIYGA